MDTATSFTLFPPVDPYRWEMLPVDQRHRLYVEESGNPDGIPVLFLHGGPGAGCAPIHRRFFDPKAYRIILFDQRGAGRSEPQAETIDNTTAHLIGDMEILRRHLGVDRWLLFGGSWGSSLALAYGIAHPEQCLGFVLRGVFLCRAAELDWFLYGLARFHPEAWRAFAHFLPEGERHDLLAGYHARLMSPDPSIHGPAAQVWRDYEATCSTLLPMPPPARDSGALALARLEAHYFINNLFMSEDALLDGLSRIRHLPASVIQGRYDMICPITTADMLVEAWPGADYVIAPTAGHSALELGVLSALVEATEKFKRKLS